METCCREILQGILEERILRNPNYSLRAFAKDIGISPASVSSVLNGRRGLSKEMAFKISNKLPFQETEKEEFVKLAESQFSRSHKKRKKAQQELKLKKIKQTNVQELLLKNWQNLALLEMISCRSYHIENIEVLGKRISLTRKDTQRLIDQMLEAKILRLSKDNILEDNLGNLEVEDSPGSKSLRDFHSQILNLASEALVHQSSDELYSQSLVFSIDEKLVPHINKEVKEFLKNISKIINTSSKGEVLRCVTIQSFLLENM